MILFYTGLIGEYHLLNLRPGEQSLYDSVLHRIDWRIPSIEPETRRTVPL